MSNAAQSSQPLQASKAKILSSTPDQATEMRLVNGTWEETSESTSANNDSSSSASDTAAARGAAKFRHAPRATETETETARRHVARAPVAAKSAADRALVDQYASAICVCKAPADYLLIVEEPVYLEKPLCARCYNVATIAAGLFGIRR